MGEKFDPDELLPFCTRCNGVGAVANETQNFCHQCGSGGTCIPVERKHIRNLQEIEDVKRGIKNT